MLRPIVLFDVSDKTAETTTTTGDSSTPYLTQVAATISVRKVDEPPLKAGVSLLNMMIHCFSLLLHLSPLFNRLDDYSLSGSAYF